MRINIPLSSWITQHGAHIYTDQLRIDSAVKAPASSPLASVFVDNQSIGFYCFPKSTKAYTLSQEESNDPYPDPESSQAINFLVSTFKSTEFWAKFLGFVSQESNREVEEINATLIKVYKSVFSYFDASIVDIVKPHIVSMASASTKKNMQRCACELITGLVSGSKHWSQSRINDMWTWLEPVLKQVFLNAPPEMLVNMVNWYAE